MGDRLTRLPPLPEQVKGFPIVDSRMQQEVISTIDFSALPERNYRAVYL